ncbi:hypothetical protein BANRA_05148 [Klebsiella pneumoniae]|nr:hypothetical protein BANRA_05625 [Klebsiella pneumoniae]VDA16451.1 hypothetical protein BANRA_05148 [Klebsiella pneumoniae]
MTFWNDSYQGELNNITNWINVNLINKSNIPSNLDAIDDEQFPDAILVHAWVYFSFLFNNRRNPSISTLDLIKTFARKGHT